MFKIGEFSKLVRVSARMLRHYEKCGLFYPAEIDPFTGYRLYSAGQIPLLSRIIKLRDMGFSIDEIGEVLPNFDHALYMEKILNEKENTIKSAIAFEKTKLKRIEELRNSMKEETKAMIYDVELKSLPKVKVLSLHEVISSYDKEGVLWEKLGRFMGQNGIACDQGGYSIYLEDEYKESDVDMEIAVPVPELAENQGEFIYKELDAIPLAATVRFSGPYENYTLTMEKLGAWMEQNGYKFAGNVRGLAIVSPQDQSQPQNYLTEIQVPVIKE